MSELLTTSETARELNVSAETIREWADQGKLSVRRTSSGQRIFERSDVERMRLERRSTQGEAA